MVFQSTEHKDFENTPWNLVNLLFELHKSKNVKPHLPFINAYLRQAKEFIKLTGDKAPEIMIMASQYTNNPFTFKYLKEFYLKEFYDNTTTTEQKRPD